jgi:hypothetical protein
VVRGGGGTSDVRNEKLARGGRRKEEEAAGGVWRLARGRKTDGPCASCGGRSRGGGVA